MSLHFEELIQQIHSKKAELVAVSKTRSVEEILSLYKMGQRHFGENRVQELRQKHPLLPNDIHWHLIGHLQSNKVKYIAPYIHLIHSVDSLSLLEEINKQGAKHNRIIPFLFQLKVAEEFTKFGLSMEACTAIIESDKFKNMKNVLPSGIMGMGTFTSDLNQISEEFKLLKKYFTELKETFFPLAEDFKEISMGMSGDYELALEEGSTLVRIGSLIFNNL